MCGKASASKSLSASVPCMDTPLPARIEGFAESFSMDCRAVRKSLRPKPGGRACPLAGSAAGLPRPARSNFKHVCGPLGLAFRCRVSKKPGGQVRELIYRSPRRRQRLVTPIGRAGAGILTEKNFGLLEGCG